MVFAMHSLCVVWAHVAFGFEADVEESVVWLSSSDAVWVCGWQLVRGDPMRGVCQHVEDGQFVGFVVARAKECVLRAEGCLCGKLSQVGDEGP